MVAFFSSCADIGRSYSTCLKTIVDSCNDDYILKDDRCGLIPSLQLAVQWRVSRTTGSQSIKSILEKNQNDTTCRICDLNPII